MHSDQISNKVPFHKISKGQMWNTVFFQVSGRVEEQIRNQITEQIGEW